MPHSPLLKPVPHLPAPRSEMTWRDLNQFKKTDRGPDFYLTCLQYAQHLWLKQLPARAILCIDRAFGADLRGDEPILQDWPLPYEALLYILEHIPDGVFQGNARIHFQHYADRLGEPRLEQRKWRSWACWAIACHARPDLPPDEKHQVTYPTLKQIAANLDTHGHPGETPLWQTTLPKPTLR